MALRRTGIELVVENFTNFMNRGGAAANVMARIAQASDIAQRKLNATAGSVQTAARNIDTATRSITQAQERLAKVQERIAELQRLSGGAPNEHQQYLIDQAYHDEAIALEALEQAHNRNANAAQKDVDTYYKMLTATEGAKLQFEGLAGVLVGNIPLLGNLAEGGQLSIAAFGGMAQILPVVGAAFAGIGLTINIVQAGLQKLGQIAQLVLAGLRAVGNFVINIFKGIGSIIEWATRPLRTFLGHVLEIASGIALWRFVRNLGESFKNLAAEVFNAVAAFQGLEIRLEGLAARDYARATGKSMAEGFKATAGQAQVLFGWMRKLAVTTPFTNEGIAQLFTLSSAMGLSIDTTKQATIAITNFASAFGLEDEVLNRIIYQFGQMTARGKLTGEEMRDLARNMVPINDIMKNLAKAAGMPTEAFREMAMRGGVPVMDFLNEFIRIANTDYPDAAKRMARTWQGATNNIKDFIDQFIGVDIFKPVMDAFAGNVADSLDKILNNKELQNATKLLGQVLLRAFNLLKPSVDALQSALGALFDSFMGGSESVGRFANNIEEATNKASGITVWARRIGVAILTVVELIKNFVDGVTNKIREWANNNDTTFGTIAKSAGEWGKKFITFFANGVKGGLQILTAVIKTIAEILKVFQPHSPPPIAPDIDKWGAETMELWIRGFTKADFSIFNDVAGLVEQYIRSLGDGIAKEAIVPAILDARNAIAQGLSGLNSGGGIGEALSTMLGGITNGTDLFRQYLQVLLQIPDAEQRVANATQAINIAQRAVDQSRARLDAFTESAFGITNAEEAVAAAGRQVTAVQDQINLVTERYDGILTDLNKQLARVTNQYDDTVRLRQINKAMSTQLLTAEEKERLEMEKRSIEIKGQIRATEDARDAELANLKAQLKAAQDSEIAQKTRLDALRAEYEAQRLILQTQVDAAEQRLKDAQQAKEDAQAQVDALNDQANAIKEQISLIIEQNNLLNEQKKILDEIAGENGAEQQYSLPDIGDTGIDDFLKEIDTMVLEAQQNAKAIGEAWQGIVDTWNSTGVGGAFEDFKNSIKGVNDQIAILLGIGGDKGNLGDAFANLWKKIREAIGIPDGQTFPEYLAKALKDNTPYIVDAAKLLGLSAILLWDAFKLIINIGKEFLDSEFFKRFSGDTLAYLTGAGHFALGTAKIGDAVTRISEILGIHLPKLNLFANWFDRFTGIMILGNPPLMILSILLDTLAKTVKAAGELWDKFGDALTKIADAMEKLRDAKTDKAIEQLDNLKRALIAFIGEVAAAILSPLSSGMSMVMAENFLAIIKSIVDKAMIPDTNRRGVGGSVKAGQRYIVGEHGREAFVPNVSGTVYPNMNYPSVVVPPIYPGGGGDTNYNIEINPTYRNVQSEAGVYYDVEAALAVIGRR